LLFVFLVSAVIALSVCSRRASYRPPAADIYERVST
jgi:hypothetical protein